jgi:molybdopterin-guanine dinucleotide biosynthesis protein A
VASNAMASFTIAAVILAGGRGSRLGGAVKALLTVGGVTLLERVRASLEGVDGPVLVAQGPHDLGGVGDPPGWSGPLAGIAAALDADAQFLLSVAVDTPFFPRDFAARAMAAIGDADVAVARHAGQAYFTNALWRVEPLRGVLVGDPGALSAAGIKGLLRGLEAAWVDWPETGVSNPFANVNSPDELDVAERRAAEFGVGKAGQNR